MITSRQAGGWQGVEAMPVDVPSAGEAVELSSGLVRSAWPDADLAGADRLSEELGCLPLAVEQAAAYLDLLDGSRDMRTPRQRRLVTRSGPWRESGT